MESSYGMNGYLYSWLSDSHFAGGFYADGAVGEYGKDAWPNYVGKVDQPSRCPEFMDALWMDSHPLDSTPIPADLEGNIGDNWILSRILNLVTDRHNGLNQNVGFVDGHVEIVENEAMWEMQWNRKWGELSAGHN